MNEHKPRYQISLALSEEDNQTLDKLREDGVPLINIFRAGMAKYMMLKQDNK